MDEIEMGGAAPQAVPEDGWPGAGPGSPEPEKAPGGPLPGGEGEPGRPDAVTGEPDSGTAGPLPELLPSAPASGQAGSGDAGPADGMAAGGAEAAAEELARQKLEQQRLEQQLAGLGLDAAGLFGLLLQSPLLRQTTALAEEALAARAAKKREEAMRGIAALAPDLGRPEQLQAAPEYPEMQRLLRKNKGMDELDAFKLAFFDRLTRQRAEAGRQGAINAARSRRHLAGAGGQPAGADELTDEEIREYRRYNPNWTVAEIRRFHREYLETAGG